MWFLPYRRFSIDTGLGHVETLERLRAMVAPSRWSWGALFGARPDKPFTGEIDDARFNLSRVIRYRNSFLPQIRGRVTAGAAGTEIKGTMAIHPLVGAFMAVWLGAAAFGAVLIGQHAMDGGRLHPGALIPFGMLVFGIALMLGCFTPEARRALRMIATAVNASRAKMV